MEGFPPQVCLGANTKEDTTAERDKTGNPYSKMCKDDIAASGASEARLAVHNCNEGFFMRPSKSLLSSIPPTNAGHAVLHLFSS